MRALSEAVAARRHAISINALPGSDRSARARMVGILPLAAVLAAAAALRFWGIGFGLPYSEARPDETALISVALGLLFAGLNPRFFHWPSLEFYVVAALYRVAWEIGHLRGLFALKFDMYRHSLSEPGPYLLVPRVLAAVAGVVTVWIVYRVAERLFDRTTALVAAFFVAVAYLHVRDSHFGVTDVPMACLAIGAMIPLSRAFVDPANTRNWLAAGVIVGLAASTRYNAGVLIAVGLVIAAIGGSGRDKSLPPRAVVRGVATFLLAALIAFVAGTPFAVLDYPQFFAGLRFDGGHLEAGHGVVLGRGWLYHLTFSLRYGLGTPLLAASIAGMVLLAARSWRTAALLCTFPILYYLILGRGYTVFARYMTPMVPFLCITAAIAVVELANRATRSWPRSRTWMVAIVATAVALPSIGRVIAFDRLISRADTRLMASRWLASRMQPSEWVADAPAAILYPLFGRPPTLQLAHFDAVSRRFLSEQNAVVTPTWIAIATSPLSVYTTVPAELQASVGTDYRLAATFSAADGPENPMAFDQQDMFFVPYTGFAARERPGPDIRIYRRIAD